MQHGYGRVEALSLPLPDSLTLPHSLTHSLSSCSRQVNFVRSTIKRDTASLTYQAAVSSTSPSPYGDLTQTVAAVEAATEESFTLQRLGYEPLPYFSDGDGDSDSVLKYKFLERFRFVVEPLADMKLHALSSSLSSSSDYYKFKVCSVAGERLLPLRLRLRQCVMVMVTVLVMSVCVYVRRRVLRGRRVVPGGRVFVLRLQRGQLRLPSAAVPVLADGGAALSRPLRRRRRHRLRGHRSAARADPT